MNYFAIMKRVFKYSAVILGGIILLGLIGATTLFLSTNGDYNVLATVSDDSTLPRVEINGYTFHAETFGNSSNPVVIVLHGGPGGDYRSLLGLQALADNHYVVFYDQRGSGLSARVPAKQLSYTSSLEDLDAFVDLYGQGKPVALLGHSWGGTLVAGYLARSPEKVDKAIMAEPGFLNSQERSDWQAYFQTLHGPNYGWLALRSGFAAQHVKGPDAYASEDFLVGANIIPYLANHPDNPYHCPGEPYGAPLWRWGTTASYAIPDSLSDADLNSLSTNAKHVDNPVLFLAGECDTWLGAELQAKHAAQYPNAELRVIAQAGHDMFWDNPEETLNVIRAFLGD